MRLSLSGAATSIIFVVTSFVATKLSKVCLSRQKYFVVTNIILSCQKFCRGKHTFAVTKDMFCHHDSHVFVATKDVFCHHDSHVFAVTKDVFCHHDSHVFAATKDVFCHHDSHVFVVTNTCLLRQNFDRNQNDSCGSSRQ